MSSCVSHTSVAHDHQMMECLPGGRASCLPSGLCFPSYSACVFCCGCGSQRSILVLSNQVQIMAKSPGRERWNPFWTYGHQFFRFIVNICLKYILSRPGETCRCSNALLRNFSVANFGTLKYSWEKRETPFGKTDFRAVGPWFAVQVTR